MNRQRFKKSDGDLFGQAEKNVKDLRGAAGNPIEFRTESLPNGNLYRVHVNSLFGTQK
jgi:hypothetical protein